MAISDTRFAFLVGVNQYHKSDFEDIPHCDEDMEELSKILVTNNYDVTLLTSNNRNKDFTSTNSNIIDNFDLFIDKLRVKSTVIIYLSGHGGMLKFEGNKSNYFFPMDVVYRNDKIGNLKRTSLDINSDFVEKLRAKKAHYMNVFFFIDACRDNPSPKGPIASIPAHSPNIPTVLNRGSNTSSVPTLEEGLIQPIIKKIITTEPLGICMFYSAVHDQIARFLIIKSKIFAFRKTKRSIFTYALLTFVKNYPYQLNIKKLLLGIKEEITNFASDPLIRSSRQEFTDEQNISKMEFGPGEHKTILYFDYPLDPSDNPIDLLDETEIDHLQFESYERKLDWYLQSRKDLAISSKIKNIISSTLLSNRHTKNYYNEKQHEDVDPTLIELYSQHIVKDIEDKLSKEGLSLEYSKISTLSKNEGYELKQIEESISISEQLAPKERRYRSIIPNLFPKQIRNAVTNVATNFLRSFSKKEDPLEYLGVTKFVWDRSKRSKSDFIPSMSMLLSTLMYLIGTMVAITLYMTPNGTFNFLNQSLFELGIRNDFTINQGGKIISYYAPSVPNIYNYSLIISGAFLIPFFPYSYSKLRNHSYLSRFFLLIAIIFGTCIGITLMGMGIFDLSYSPEVELFKSYIFYHNLQVLFMGITTISWFLSLILSIRLPYHTSKLIFIDYTLCLIMVLITSINIMSALSLIAISDIPFLEEITPEFLNGLIVYLFFMYFGMVVGLRFMNTKYDNTPSNKYPRSSL